MWLLRPARGGATRSARRGTSERCASLPSSARLDYPRARATPRAASPRLNSTEYPRGSRGGVYPSRPLFSRMPSSVVPSGYPRGTRGAATQLHGVFTRQQRRSLSEPAPPLAHALVRRLLGRHPRRNVAALRSSTKWRSGSLVHSQLTGPGGNTSSENATPFVRSRRFRVASRIASWSRPLKSAAGARSAERPARWRGM